MKESFIFYKSFMDAIEQIPQIKYRYLLLETIIKVGLFSEESIEKLESFCIETEQKLSKNYAVLAIFLSIKPQLIANYKKYLNGCKGKQGGSLGGAPKGNQNASKNNPKTTPNENDNDNDNVNDNVNENENDKKNKLLRNLLKKGAFKKEFFEIIEKWLDYKKAKGQTYKSEESLALFIKKLLELSDNDVGTALKVIEQSMANNWSGIFHLKVAGDCFYKDTTYDPRNDPDSPLYDPLYIPPPKYTLKPKQQVDEENDKIDEVLGF